MFLFYIYINFMFFVFIFFFIIFFNYILNVFISIMILVLRIFAHRSGKLTLTINISHEEPGTTPCLQRRRSWKEYIKQLH